MKFMKRSMTLVLSLLLVLLTACGGGTTSGDVSNGDKPKSSDNAEAIKWDFAIFVGLTHPMGVLATDFANDVREKTNGKLDITVRPAGELPYKVDEFVRVTGDNSVQMSDPITFFIAGDLGAGALPNLPYLIGDFDQLDQTMEVLKPYIEKDLSRFGTKMLYYYPWPPQNLWGKGDLISSLGDMKGTKIRSQSPEQSVFAEGLGGSPVSLVTAEVPAAVQRGMADAVITAALNIEGSKWNDFLDWGYMIGLQTPPSYVIVNQQAYDSLPDDVRAVLDEVSNDYQGKVKQRMQDIEEQSKKHLTDAGMKIVDAPQEEVKEMINQSIPYWTEWAKEKGPEAEEALQKVREKLNK